MSRIPMAVRAALGLAALTASQLAWARPTNFRGFDEWVVLSLLSRGIVDAPYARRPLAFAFALPSWWLAPDRLLPFLLLHALYLAAAGLFVFLTVRLAWPQATRLAWLAAALAVVWSPTDATRLCSVQMILYSGLTFAVTAAHWLVLRSWRLGQPAWLVPAAVAAAVAALAHEGALPALALAPAWLFLADADAEGLRAPRWRITAIWALVLAACGAWYLLAFAAGGDPVRYQTGHLGGRATAGTFLANLGARLGEHVWPLFANALGGRDGVAVLIALAVFAMGTAAVFAGDDGAPSHRAGTRVVAIGVAWTVLAHLPFAISTAIRGPSRTQFLSAPGLGLVLAGLVAALWRLPWRRAGQALAIALPLWVVAQGTARTLAFQHQWDESAFFRRQARTLSELLGLAPDLRPGTLVVLLGEDGSVWKLEAGFHHAVSYVYEGRAIGHAYGVDPFLYTTRFEAGGVVHEPAEVIRGPWREPARRFGYDEVVVVRAGRRGRLTLLETWPAELPPLPAGARYAPRDRIGAGPVPPRARLVLQNR